MDQRCYSERVYGFSRTTNASRVASIGNLNRWTEVVTNSSLHQIVHG
jgi:hypothetical protein